MNMPGFTADSSLYSGRTAFASTTAPTSSGRNSQVTPAAFNITCYLNSYFRTYSRCISIGYGEGSCSDVADGVAGSVCR
jgi:hypothetical protein